MFCANGGVVYRDELKPRYLRMRRFEPCFAHIFLLIITFGLLLIFIPTSTLHHQHILSYLRNRLVTFLCLLLYPPLLPPSRIFKVSSQSLSSSTLGGTPMRRTG
jgi:hypothetical protein